jgi:hypothetical protein
MTSLARLFAISRSPRGAPRRLSERRSLEPAKTRRVADE